MVELENTTSTPDDEKKKLEFAYDGTGRRMEKTVYSDWNGSAYGTTNVTKYIWDGWLLLAELDENNAIENYHVWGLDLSATLQGAGGVGGLLSVSVNSVVYLPCYDGNGNVVDVLDEQGTSVAHYEYDPFGRTVSSTGTFTDDNHWRFSTKSQDENGLYYYGYRYYSPELGRWPSRDPIGEKMFQRQVIETGFLGNLNPAFAGLMSVLETWVNHESATKASWVERARTCGSSKLLVNKLEKYFLGTPFVDPKLFIGGLLGYARHDLRVAYIPIQGFPLQMMVSKYRFRQMLKSLGPKSHDSAVVSLSFLAGMNWWVVSGMLQSEVFDEDLYRYVKNNPVSYIDLLGLGRGGCYWWKYGGQEFCMNNGCGLNTPPGHFEQCDSCCVCQMVQ